MDIDLINLEIEEKMEIVVKKYLQNIIKITSGRANPRILEHVKINYFGTWSPLNQLAQIIIPEAHQMLIKPYDKNVNKQIVGSINNSSLDIVAVDEGDKARITFPETTKERRIELTKSLNKYTEQARIQIRAARHDGNKLIKNISNLPEDEEKRELDKIQKLTDKYILKIDKETKIKEKELMTI